MPVWSCGVVASAWSHRPKIDTWHVPTSPANLLRLGMHSLAVLVVPNDPARANMRPLVARDPALSARIDTLLFRYEQPGEMAWGVDHSSGFQFDWCVIGGRWAGWGRQVRRLMDKQKIQPSGRPIPQFLERNAVWSEDVGRVHMSRQSVRVHQRKPCMRAVAWCAYEHRQLRWANASEPLDEFGGRISIDASVNDFRHGKATAPVASPAWAGAKP